jgi:outer membrane protein
MVWQDVKSAQNRILAAESSLKSTKVSFDLANKQYQVGGISLTDLLISQRNYYNVRGNYLQAKYMSILYGLLLDFYQGKEMTF